MNNKEIITLSGFGDFYADEDGSMLKAFQDTAKKYGIECYSTYYDWELKGDRDTIETITKELWTMERDEWPDNALIETIIIE